jgi:tetratricopeptide (TPR) repeat protein
MRRLQNAVPYCAALVVLCVASIVHSAGAADNLNIKQAGQATQQEATPLELGKPVERELAEGQSHSYQITLAAGQYLNVLVEQRGIDVVVRLQGPDGKLIFEFDSEIRKQGQEAVPLVAEVAGSYRLNVQAKLKEAPAGGYEIRAVELRAATEKDRALQEAHNLHSKVSLLKYSNRMRDEIRSMAERALEIREKALGLEHSDVARSLFVLAIIYKSSGDLAKAEPLYQRALSIWKKTLGPDHPYLAEALIELADIYRYKGNYAKEELLEQHALVITEKAFGRDSSDFALSLYQLAGTYKDIGDYVKAESLYQQALAISEKTLGPKPQLIALLLSDLAFTYRYKGEYARAEELHERALAILERVRLF